MIEFLTGNNKIHEYSSVTLVNPMKQRHKYEYNIDINGPTAAAAVVRMVGKGKRVLEIGAGPGSITRFLHGQVVAA